jgi:hypothetical protein
VWIERALHHAPFLSAYEQAGALEDREVLHETGQRHRRALGECAHRRRTPGELLDDRAPRGIGEGGEDPVEDGCGWGGAAGRGLIVNHMV